MVSEARQWRAISASLMVLALSLLSAPLFSQPAELVKDIRTVLPTQNEDSDPAHLTVSGGLVFFTAADDVHGRELWRSDGTAAGTFLLKDINPGPTSTFNLSSNEFVDVDGRLFFRAFRSDLGSELWVSDGTPEGTVLVRDLAPGSGNGLSVGVQNMIAFGGRLYFSGTGPEGEGRELWESDGTAAGTKIVSDLNSSSSSSNPTNLSVANGLLYFTANVAAQGGWTLWRSDGTEAGTVFVADPNPGGITANISRITGVGSTVYFGAENATDGIELWTTDGTPGGTMMVENINPGGDSSPTALTSLGSELLFIANDGTGKELWKSDGTSLGTKIVKDINPAGAGLSQTLELGVLGSEVFFEADDSGGTRELWKSDGTSAGTVLVKNIGGNPREFAALGSEIYFAFTDNSGGGRELWKSDGTDAGTVRVKDIVPGGLSSVPEVLADGELWKSDGSEVGTVLVQDLRPPDGSSNPTELTDFGGVVMFAAHDGVVQNELWISNGTSAGTELVKDIRSGNSSDPEYLTVVELTPAVPTLFFSALDGGTSGTELWKSDGTELGTELVKDIRSGSTGSSPANLTARGSELLFSANDGTNGIELWKSDGTSGGTTMVEDIRAGSLSSSPSEMTESGGVVYMAARDLSNGTEPWVSDGTAPGTDLLKDTVAGTTGSSPTEFTQVGSTVYFEANNDLWKTDGTPLGTVLVKNTPQAPQELTASGGTLYFTLQGDLWMSDGTDPGTVVVKDFTSPTANGWPTELTDVGGTLLFAVNDGTNGNELWTSDGTEVGTVLVRDIAPGPFSSDPRYFFEYNGYVFFTASNPWEGSELWRSDGTPEGTAVIQDIAVGAAGSFPTGLTESGGRIYFSADDGTGTGIELWSFVPDFMPPRVVEVGSTADTGDGVLAENEATNVELTAFSFTFDEKVQDFSGTTRDDDVDNPANYALYSDAGDGFQTVDCSAGVDASDTAIAIDSVVWDENALAAALTVNGGVALPDGLYRLAACGTTSLRDLAINRLDGDGNGVEGDDFVRTFIVDRTDSSEVSSLSSSSHPVSTPTSNSVISVSWTAATDNLSGVDGYSIVFNATPTTTCDETKELEESATSTASDILANGTWYFHICVRDNAGNWTSGVTAGPFLVDASSPKVLLVNSNADTGDGALGEGETSNTLITELFVTFDEEVLESGAAGADSVSNPANYLLVESDGDGLDTLSCAAGVAVGDQAISVDSASWNEPTLTGTLAINGGSPLLDGDYRFFVCGTTSIVDLAGNVLDGNGDGAGGDDFVRSFTLFGTRPFADAGEDRTIDINTETIVLGGMPSATAGQPPYGYSWTVSPGTEGVDYSLGSSTAADPDFTGHVVGTYTVELEVSDSNASTGNDEAAIEVVCPMQLDLFNTILDGSLPKYEASQTVTAELVTVAAGGGVSFVAGSSTILIGGFVIEEGAVFSIVLDSGADCSP